MTRSSIPRPPGIEFLHGYTYSGHPLGAGSWHRYARPLCEEGLFQRAAALSARFEAAVHSLAEFPHVIDVRNIGLMAGIELAPRPGAPGRPDFRGVSSLLRRRAADPGHRRHHRAFAAPDRRRTPDRRDCRADRLGASRRGVDRRGEARSHADPTHIALRQAIHVVRSPRHRLNPWEFALRIIDHFIAGHPASDDGGPLSDVYDPSTGRIQARVRQGGSSDIDRAVAVAKATQSGWGNLNPQRRGRVLLRFKDLVERELARSLPCFPPSTARWWPIPRARYSAAST